MCLELDILFENNTIVIGFENPYCNNTIVM